MSLRRSHRLFAAVLGVAATGSLLLSFAGAGAASGTAVTTDQLNADAANSQAIGETMATFAGMYISGQTIYVGVTQDTPAIESQIENGANASEYAFTVQPRSWNTLLALQTAFVTGAPPAGLTFSEVWPDPTTDTLGVGLTTMPANAVPAVLSAITSGAFAANLSPSAIESNALSVSLIPLGNGQPLTDTRSHDASPWNGGDYLSISKTGSTCSSGPPVTGNTSGDDYVLTAGHCFSIGDTVHNYDAYSSVGGNGTVGTINFGTYADEDDGDVKGILTTGFGGSSSLDYFGTGGPGDSTKVTVNSGRDPVVGSAVCGDGAFDGKLCGGTVEKILVCKTYTGGDGTTHCGEDEETSPGTYIAGEGDSGGPVTGPAGSTAFGTIAFGEGSVYQCNVENPTGSRSCYGTVWFESMGYIQRFWGVTVK